MPAPREKHAASHWNNFLNYASTECGKNPARLCPHRAPETSQAAEGLVDQGPEQQENRHIRLVGQPVTLSRTPSKMAARPPEFGEQTDEVLAEFGFTANEIGTLRRDKVV